MYIREFNYLNYRYIQVDVVIETYFIRLSDKIF